MSADFEVKVLSPSSRLGSYQVSSLSLPGSQGYMTILAHHADMVAELGFGEMSLKLLDGSEMFFFISGGFVDVKADQATVIADVVEKAPDIDTERAKASMERALERLEGGSKQDIVDVDRANRSLQRAQYRNMIAQTIASASQR